MSICSTELHRFCHGPSPTLPANYTAFSTRLHYISAQLHQISTELHHFLCRYQRYHLVSPGKSRRRCWACRCPWLRNFHETTLRGRLESGSLSGFPRNYTGFRATTPGLVANEGRPAGFPRNYTGQVAALYGLEVVEIKRASTSLLRRSASRNCWKAGPSKHLGTRRRRSETGSSPGDSERMRPA